MTKQQLEYYLMGGIFKATYDPVDKYDLFDEVRRYIGKRIEVYQGLIITPVIGSSYLKTSDPTVAKYEGQHFFTSDVIRGAIPEEDLKDLEITSEHIGYDTVPLPQWIYKITFTDMNQVKCNMGVGYEDINLPHMFARAYKECRNHYVVHELLDPRATKVEVMAWNPLDPLWKEEWTLLWDQSDKTPEEIIQLEYEREQMLKEKPTTKDEWP